MSQDAGQHIHFESTGPGTHAADGSSVELYLLLKPHGEPEVIRGVLAKGSSILELGCGVGRITTPLVQFGFEVVGVDNSDEMLAFVKNAKTIKSDIETLNVGRTFDAVLLMSHLINIPSASVRRAFLATCRRHVTPHGILIIQRYRPEWLDALQVGPLGRMDGIDAFVDSVRHEGSIVDMTLRWQRRSNTWTQSSSAQRLDDDEIERNLSEADLKIESWLDERRTWLVARPNK